MLIFFTALFFFIFTSPVLAVPRICKFHAQDTNDWIEICNDSGTVDLSLYYVADLDQTNKKYLNCTFNTAINIPLSNILNNGGDTISLIEISSGESVSTIRYCDSSISTCPPDSDVVDIKDSLCGLINPDDTRTVSSDPAICLPLSATCPVSSTPPSPASITPPPAASINLETSITNLSSSANLGQNLTLSFSINSNLPDAEFYLKIFGGVNDDYSIETQNNSNWYNYNSAWTDMPKVKTGSDGKYSGQITIRPKPDKETGNYRVQIKVRALSGSPEKISGITYLSVSSVPTSIPTQTPAPTSSLTPSPTPTPSPSPTSTLQPTQYSEPAVLAATDTNFSPTPTSILSTKTRPQINLPVMLMILGSLLLLTPLAVSKFPHAKI